MRIIRVSALAGACAAFASGCGTGDRVSEGADGSTLALQILDSAVLAEPDSAPIAQPVELLVRDEDVFVADQASRRVYRYSRAGELLQIVGHPGRGPGEFEAPFRMVAVGDSMLVVAERGRKVLAMFDVSSGEHRLDVPHEGSVYGLAATESGVAVGNVNPDGWTALGSWKPGMGAVHSYGRMPLNLLEVATLPPMKMSIAVTPSPRGIGVLFSNVDSLFVYDDSGSVVERTSVPRARRRGEPGDAEERSRLARDVPARYEVLSTAAAIQYLSVGHWAAVHFDFSLAGSRLTAIVWVSVLARDGSWSCVDASLPVSDDGMPSVRFNGDTLFVLDQLVTESGAKTRLRSWLIDAAACRRPRT